MGPPSSNSQTPKKKLRREKSKIGQGCQRSRVLHQNVAAIILPLREVETYGTIVRVTKYLILRNRELHSCLATLILLSYGNGHKSGFFGTQGGHKSIKRNGKNQQKMINRSGSRERISGIKNLRESIYELCSFLRARGDFN